MNHSTAKLTLAAALAGGGILAVASTGGAQGIGVDTLEKMLVPTETKIERGKQIYESKCAGCHGPGGAGDANYPADKFANKAPNFADGQYRHGSGKIQVYNAITKGLSGTAAEGEKPLYHPVFTESLRYQERWAVTHYVREELSADQQLGTDPAPVVDQARLEAREGTCDPEIKKTIASRVEPKGEEQMKTGEELYNQQCTTCHGESGKGDGPAGSGLQPAPRNFHATDVKWTKGTSPLNIFNTLTNGIEGSAMASYSTLSEDERWALTHYVRKWIPEEKRQESTPEDITAVCRSLSKPDPPEPISVEAAMQALIDDQSEERTIKLKQYGDIVLSPDADAERGEAVYQQKCAQCHGQDFGGANLGPYGVERVDQQKTKKVPTLYLRVRSLRRAHASGNYKDFATRSTGGVHATLPDMSSAALMNGKDWQDLQAYIAVEGEGEVSQVTTGTPEAPAEGTAPADAPQGDAGTAGGPDAGNADGPDAGTQPANGPDAGQTP
jgi:mono/diheme cytochrome c family protein